ncbi:MAG: hypothetical protein WCO75_06520 [Planctomycetota bacterium]
MDNTRRSFLTTAAALGAAGFAASIASRSFGNSQVGGSTPVGAGSATPPTVPPAAPAAMIVGSGSTRYEVHHDWLVPPPGGAAFGDTHGVAQDAKGNIYLAHTVHSSSTLKDAVYVYSSDGKFLRSFGKEFAGGAHGMDLHTENGTEFLYHCDTGRRMVVKTTLDGTVLWEAGCPMESGVYESADKWCPTNSAFGPDGTVFIGDGYGSSFIHAFSADGKWKKIIARPGKDPGQVACPHGIYVDSRGTNFTREPALVVADRGNRRIQYMSLDGAHLGFVTNSMRQPCDMKVRGDRMLVPDLDSVVTILDAKNAPIVQLCDGNPSALRGASRDQFIPGKFVHPHDAIWLANGDILVAEWVPIGRVTLLRAVS